MRGRTTPHKVAAFTVVMVVVAAGLIVVFGDFRFSAGAGYHAVFADASRLTAGSKVRMSGADVGTVDRVRLNRDATVTVDFSIDKRYQLFSSTRALIRYENLVGDRYLQVDTPAGEARPLPRGATLGTGSTQPALDFDALLGGLRPVTKGLDGAKVNEITGAIVQLLQGQGGALSSLLANTSAFSQALARRQATIAAVLRDLEKVIATIDAKNAEFDASLDEVQKLISGLAQNRDPVAGVIAPLASAESDLTDMLVKSRRPLQGVLENTRPLMTELDQRKAEINKVIEHLPEDYLRVMNLGAYGSFFNIFFCEVRFKINGPAGSDMIIPVGSPVDPTKGRCADV